MKKALFLAAVVVAAVLIGWAVMQHRHRADDGRLVLQGNVDIRQVSLAFDGSGRVAEMRVEEGDRVKAGQVLAVLDTRTLALQAAQVQAQVDAQQQVLLRLRSGSRPEEVDQARNRARAAQADATQAGLDLKRLQTLSTNTGGRAVSGQDLDRARSTLQVAQARLAEQREALRLLELGPRAEDIAGAEAQLKAVQAQLAVLAHQVSLGELRAPTDAVVRSRLMEPGDMATPQRAVFALALTQPKWVRAYVSEPDLGRVRPGLAARVTTDGASAAAINGRVGYIASVAEFTPKAVQTDELRTSLVYEVRVVVEDPGDVLRLGQPATVEFAARQLASHAGP